MKSSPSLKIFSLVLVMSLFAASCANPSTPTGPAPTDTASPAEMTQTFEAAVAQSVQGTLEAITGYSNEGTVVRDLIQADENGGFTVENATGEQLSITLEDSTGEKVGNASILSATNADGVLLLVVPPADLLLVPKFVFLEKSQAQAFGKGLASLSAQSVITISLSSSQDPITIDETDVPPGLLEALFSSPGWEKTVVSTQALCDSLSTFSSLGSVAYLSYGASRTVMDTLSLKHLVSLLIPDADSVTGVGLAEGFVPICLAATGDPAGLVELTGVIHPQAGFGMIFLTNPIPVVVKGRAVDSGTNNPLQGTVATTPEHQTLSLSDGTFYLPIPANTRVELACKMDGFATQRMTVAPISARFADIGDLLLASVATGFTEEFNNLGDFFQTSGNITLVDGKANWLLTRNGVGQFIYRNIPAVSGNVRITVIGQVDDWTDNCRGGVGIGDAPGSGIAVYFGFSGGGCSISGPAVTAGGVTLNMQQNYCVFTPNWPWIQAKTPYKVMLSAQYPYADLEVEGIGSVTGTVDYNGEYNVLWVGLQEGGDASACSGSFDSILIEPIP